MSGALDLLKAANKVNPSINPFVDKNGDKRGDLENVNLSMEVGNTSVEVGIDGRSSSDGSQEVGNDAGGSSYTIVDAENDVSKKTPPLQFSSTSSQRQLYNTIDGDHEDCGIIRGLVINDREETPLVQQGSNEIEGRHLEAAHDYLLYEDQFPEERDLEADRKGIMKETREEFVSGDVMNFTAQSQFDKNMMNEIMGGLEQGSYEQRQESHASSSMNTKSSSMNTNDHLTSDLTMKKEMKKERTLTVQMLKLRCATNRRGGTLKEWMRRIQYLHLEDLKLNRLGASFSENLPNLKVLYGYDNQIGPFVDRLPPKIEQLYLQDNNIENFDQSVFFNNHSTTNLDSSAISPGNPSGTTILSSLGSSPVLRILNLSGNSLKSIEFACQFFSCLGGLGDGNNQSIIKGGIRGDINSSSIVNSGGFQRQRGIAGGGSTTTMGGIGGGRSTTSVESPFSNLEDLNVSKNPLTFISLSVCAQNLRTLDVSNCCLENLKFLHPLRNLESLKVENNYIGVVEDGTSKNGATDDGMAEIQGVNIVEDKEENDAIKRKSSSEKSSSEKSSSEKSSSEKSSSEKKSSSSIYSITECLSSCPDLRVLQIHPNPVTIAEKKYKEQLILALRNLETIDKKEITQRERTFLIELYKRRNGV